MFASPFHKTLTQNVSLPPSFNSFSSFLLFLLRPQYCSSSFLLLLLLSEDFSSMILTAVSSISSICRQRQVESLTLKDGPQDFSHKSVPLAYVWLYGIHSFLQWFTPLPSIFQSVNQLLTQVRSSLQASYQSSQKCWHIGTDSIAAGYW